MRPHTITIATPFYDEEASLPDYFLRINELCQNLELKDWQTTLLLINDGSQDCTLDKLKKFAQSHPGTIVVTHFKNLGYGASIKTALSVACTEWIAFVDADTNYDQRLILKLVDYLDENVDIVNVSILAPGGHAGYRWQRYIISFAVSQCYKFFFPRLTKGIYTMTCGFRIYKQSIVPKIFPINDGFVATSEIMIRALKNKMMILEFPTDNAKREHGKSKMRFIKTIYDHVGFVLRVFWGQLMPPAIISEHQARIHRIFD